VLALAGGTVKSIGKLREVLPFSEGIVKKLLASLEMCWNTQKELLKKCW
jgi:hypothetical protein